MGISGVQQRLAKVNSEATGYLLPDLFIFTDCLEVGRVIRKISTVQTE